MKAIRNSTILSLLAFIILASAVSCKSSKKALEASNAAKEKERLAQESALRKQKEAEELKWKELEAKAKLEAEKMEAEKKAAEERERASAASTNESAKLSQYFETIATSGSATSANSSINEALSLFSSRQTPVLIVISEYNGQKDYDKPTTIEKYLNYLKDQKKNTNKVSNLKVDASGKITEVELKKNL